MILRVSGPTIAVDQIEDFTTFSVDAAGHRLDAVEQALTVTGFGRLMSADHAWINRSALEQHAEQRGLSASWLRGFTRMIGFAKTRGWTSEDDSAIAAHITGLAG